MRFIGILACLAGLMGMVGCTHRSLSRNMIQATSTVMEIQYNSVLSNLAMMASHPEALPNHVSLADSVVQINDRAGFGQSGGFDTGISPGFSLNQFGPSGQRQVTEQWGTDATTDPERLYDLQCLYRAALGWPPLPPTFGIMYLRSNPEAEGRGDTEKTSGTTGISTDGVIRTAAQGGTMSTGGGGSTPGSSSSGGGSRGLVPIDILLLDVPQPGWYEVGGKKDVPKDACYVGRWGNCYAWVTADGVPQLTRFTITALTVIKLSPGERASGGKSGLAVTN